MASAIHKVKKVCTLFCVLALAFSLSFSCIASNCQRSLTVYANDEWPPYSYLDKNTFKGIEIDILEKVLLDAGFCWEYVSYPSSSRAIRELKKGNVDLLFAATFTDARNGKFLFSEPYREEKMVLFGRNSHENTSAPISSQTLNYSDVQSMLEKHITVINRGSVYGREFTKFKDACSDCIVELNLATERFSLVSSKRADYLVEDYFSGLYILKNNIEYESSVMLLPTVIHLNPVHYMMRKDLLNQLELEKLNNSIQKNQTHIRDVINKYTHIYLAK